MDSQNVAKSMQTEVFEKNAGCQGANMSILIDLYHVYNQTAIIIHGGMPIQGHGTLI